MGNKFENMIEKLTDCLQSSDIIAAEQQAKIASIIMKNRIEREMNQKEFAEFMGVSQGMVSKWESQEYNFTIDSLARICDKLDLELDVEMKPNSKAKLKYNQVNWTVAMSLNGKIGGVA